MDRQGRIEGHRSNAEQQNNWSYLRHICETRAQREIAAEVHQPGEEHFLIDLMKTDTVRSWEPIYGGSTRPWKVTLESGIVGIFKPESQNDPWTGCYEAEVASCQVSERIELASAGVWVPPTVVREVMNEQGRMEKGSLQQWIENLVPGSSTYLSNDVRFFNYITANNDRGNEMSTPNYGFLRNTDGDIDSTVLFDNANSFKSTVLPPTSDELPLLIPSSNVLEKTRIFDVNGIECLSSQECFDMAQRRDTLIRAIDEFNSQMQRY